MLQQICQHRAVLVGRAALAICQRRADQVVVARVAALAICQHRADQVVVARVAALAICQHRVRARHRLARRRHPLAAADLISTICQRRALQVVS